MIKYGQSDASLTGLKVFRPFGSLAATCISKPLLGPANETRVLQSLRVAGAIMSSFEFERLVIPFRWDKKAEVGKVVQQRE